MQYLPEFLTIATIALITAITPGVDFIVVMRNSLVFGRKSGVYTAIGIGLAIWVHVAYTVAGLAVLIEQSTFLFSVIKYLGALYLIYIGISALRASFALSPATDATSDESISELNDLEQSPLQALKQGFITNVFNPKASIFFLSIFTQIADATAPTWMQLTCGGIISVTVTLWFCSVASFFTRPVLLAKFNRIKHLIERASGILLLGLGIKIALATQD